MASTTTGKWGKHYTSDGPSVEGSVMRMKRYKTPKGETYHMVNFKLRKHQWEGLANAGESGKWGFTHASYDAKEDAFVETAGASDTVATRKWTVGNSEVHLAAGKHKYAYMGSVYMKIRPKKGQTHEDVVKEALETMKPGLSKEVLRDPTPEEQEVLRLSKILWARSPKKADALAEKDRTVANLKKMLKAAKVSTEEIANTKHEEVYPGYSAHVQKGRHKKLLEKGLRFAHHGADEGAILSILQTGPMGIHERNQHGIGKTGVSYESDVASGSGDGVLCNLATANQDGKSTNGYSFSKGYQVIVHPEELDRLDTYMHFGDQFGNCRDDNGTWTGRTSLEAKIAAQNKASQHSEMSFRKGIRPERMMRITCGNENARKNMIKKARAAGIQEVNGVPIEDFLIVETKVGAIYEKYIKPMLETD
jgi:hypothetical protein